MLQIIVPDIELWDAKNEMFVNISGETLYLEHSLVAISKWESKWKKAFLGSIAKTNEETSDYIRCMLVKEPQNPAILNYITNDSVDTVTKYIKDTMTATTFSKKAGKGECGRKIVTSEVIYYWMASYGIPFECENWHLNRLMTLIRVAAEYNNPKNKKKGSGLGKDYISRRNAINRARKAQMGSIG